MLTRRIYARYPPPRLTGPRRRGPGQRLHPLADRLQREFVGDAQPGGHGRVPDRPPRPPAGGARGRLPVARPGGRAPGTGVRTGVRASRARTASPAVTDCSSTWATSRTSTPSPSPSTALLDGVDRADHAVGAGRPDHVGAVGQGLVGALEVDPLADPRSPSTCRPRRPPQAKPRSRHRCISTERTPGTASSTARGAS